MEFPCPGCRFLTFEVLRTSYTVASKMVALCGLLEATGWRAVQHVGVRLEAGMALPCGDCGPTLPVAPELSVRV